MAIIKKTLPIILSTLLLGTNAIGELPNNAKNTSGSLAVFGDATGATNIIAGSEDTYNESTKTLTWNTNAASGGGVGTITNILSSDSSIVWTDSGGPEPDGSITSYVDTALLSYVPTNDPSYLEIQTNMLAFHAGTNISIRTDSTNIYFDATGVSNLYSESHQPYTHDLISADGTVATIAYSYGSLIRFVMTNTPITLTFTNATFPTGGVSRVAVEVWAGTNTLAFDTDVITNAVAPTISTGTWNSLFFRRTADEPLWRGRQ